MPWDYSHEKVEHKGFICSGAWGKETRQADPRGLLASQPSSAQAPGSFSKRENTVLKNKDNRKRPEVNLSLPQYYKQASVHPPPTYRYYDLNIHIKKNIKNPS